MAFIWSCIPAMDAGAPPSGWWLACSAAFSGVGGDEPGPPGLAQAVTRATVESATMVRIDDMVIS
jgi:hypothetical protein